MSHRHTGDWEGEVSSDGEATYLERYRLSLRNLRRLSLLLRALARNSNRTGAQNSHRREDDSATATPTCIEIHCHYEILGVE